MRWKLLRRRMSISAPRMVVRSYLPWPLRWGVIALTFGFSAALAMWAFEFGQNITGLDRSSADELKQLRVDTARLLGEREQATSVANTAESLLKTEKTVQEGLARQLRLAEAENLALKSDLGFFQRLLPTAPGESLIIRGLQVEQQSPGHVRYQLLVMQPGRTPSEFNGGYEITLVGNLDGKPWSFVQPGAAQRLRVKQYLRVEGVIDHPAQAVVKAASVRVMDLNGAVKANLTVNP